VPPARYIASVGHVGALLPAWEAMTADEKSAMSAVRICKTVYEADTSRARGQGNTICFHNDPNAVLKLPRRLQDSEYVYIHRDRPAVPGQLFTHRPEHLNPHRMRAGMVEMRKANPVYRDRIKDDDEALLEYTLIYDQASEAVVSQDASKLPRPSTAAGITGASVNTTVPTPSNKARACSRARPPRRSCISISHARRRYCWRANQYDM
jgi:hypothetical protein